MPSILITGAGRGFGRDLMEVYAERGWTVFPLVRDAAVAAQLRFCHGGTFHPIVGDVTTDAVEREISSALARHTESLDVLVNNADTVKKLRDLEFAAPDDLDDLFRAHCTGPLRCARAALPFLRSAHRAIVVNVTSRSCPIARSAAGRNGGIFSHHIARSAQNILSTWLNRELKPEGIRVFALHLETFTTGSAAFDALPLPRDAAPRFADWVGSCDREEPVGAHDLPAASLIAW